MQLKTSSPPMSFYAWERWQHCKCVHFYTSQQMFTLKLNQRHISPMQPSVHHLHKKNSMARKTFIVVQYRDFKIFRIGIQDQALGLDFKIFRIMLWDQALGLGFRIDFGIRLQDQALGLGFTIFRITLWDQALGLGFRIRLQDQTLGLDFGIRFL